MTVVPQYRFPSAPRGAAIGLFGGSFDPAHVGHVHVTRHALRRLGLDQMWWLVSPGNPLKPQGPAPIEVRMRHARKIMRDPRVQISDLESHLGTRYTADTLSVLLARFPRRRFVWVMGADNLAGFHHWENWRWIMDSVPIAVIARPGELRRAMSSVAARSYSHSRVSPGSARFLAQQNAPCWCFLPIPMRDMSSTRLRAEGRGLA